MRQGAGFSAMTKAYAISKDATEAPLFAHELEALKSPQCHVLDLGAGKGTFNYGNFSCSALAADEDLPSGPTSTLTPPDRPGVRCL